MELGFLIGVVVATSLISFFVGFTQGFKAGTQKVLRTLGVRPGYRISGVSFEKMD